MHCTRTTQQNLDFLFPLAAVRDAITELSSHVAISGKKVRLRSVLFAVRGCSRSKRASIVAIRRGLRDYHRKEDRMHTLNRDTMTRAKKPKKKKPRKHAWCRMSEIGMKCVKHAD